MQEEIDVQVFKIMCPKYLFYQPIFINYILTLFPSKNYIKHLASIKKKCKQSGFIPWYLAVNKYKTIAVLFKQMQLSGINEQIF